jgi:hypothetical protein
MPILPTGQLLLMKTMRCRSGVIYIEQWSAQRPFLPQYADRIIGIGLLSDSERAIIIIIIR